MKKTALLAASLLCLTAGAAFAGGEGDGPYGIPDTAASYPAGFLNGTVTYQDEMRAYRASGEVTPDPASGLPSAGASPTAPTAGVVMQHPGGFISTP